jgi:hypothetical protein
MRLARVISASVLASAAALVAPSMAAASVPASTDVKARVATWDIAASRLGMAGSLWEPVRTLGLTQSGRIDVLADKLSFGAGTVLSGDTYAGATYGTAARTFTIAEKWANTGWAAEPVFTTSSAKVRTVPIGVGVPGLTRVIRAQIFANCFVQPADADPRPIPKRFRCTKADVLRTGGTLVMTVRPATTMTDPGDTSVVITSTGLTFDQLIRIAHSLQQVAGNTAQGGVSAQMVGMCRQMVEGAMTADQAQAFASSNGYSTRVGSVDGQPLAVTMDYRPDRFTLAIAGGTVASCTYG